MGIAFIKVSVCYFMMGIVMGMYMGITDQFQFTSAHAHINLLGWVSSALAGVIYLQIPKLGLTKLAQFHFWLYMTGVPLLTGAMILFGLGIYKTGVLLSAIGGSIVTLSVLAFVINVLFNLKQPAKHH